MIPSLVALIQEAGLSEDAKRQAAHALAMLAAEEWGFVRVMPHAWQSLTSNEV